MCPSIFVNTCDARVFPNSEYMHHDAHGSPRLVYSDSDELMAKVEYTPYGRVLRSAGGMAYFGYTGKIQSGYAGHVHFPLRQYDPELYRCAEYAGVCRGESVELRGSKWRKKLPDSEQLEQLR